MVSLRLFSGVGQGVTNRLGIRPVAGFSRVHRDRSGVMV